MPAASRYAFYPRDAMPARVLAMALCPCLCLSVSHKSVFYRNAWTDRDGFLACRLLWIYPTLCFKEIRVCSKMSPSGTLLQTLDVASFATASRRYTGDIHTNGQWVCL